MDIPLDILSATGSVLTTLMPSWTPGTWKVLAQLPGGYAHVNVRLRYRNEDFALRLPGATRDHSALRFEEEWLAKLPAGTGAEVVAFDADSGALLTRWIDAPLLIDSPAAPAELVGYLVALHRQLPPAARSHDLAARIDAWLEGINPPVHVLRARSMLDAPPFCETTCHNDLNPWNVLRGPGGFRTLDWEWVGLNDALFDLATLAFGAGFQDAEFAEMAAAYARLRQLPRMPDAGEVQRAIQSFWLREYAWATGAIRGGNQRDEVISQMHTALQRLDTNGLR